MFEQDTFPPYANGPLYVLSQSVTKKLLEASRSEPFFKMEDVYVTGILAQKCGLKPLHNPLMYTIALRNTCQHRRCIMEHLEKERIHELPQIMKDIFNHTIMCAWEPSKPL